MSTFWTKVHCISLANPGPRLEKNLEYMCNLILLNLRKQEDLQEI